MLARDTMVGNDTHHGKESQHSAFRREFIKNLGLVGVSTSVGFSQMGGVSRAATAEPDPKVDSTTQTTTLPSAYYYDTRYLDAGSSIERIDSAYYADKWHYVYRTEACCSVADHKEDTNETNSSSIITGDEGFKIEELDAPDTVSTSIYGNSDWGIGVQGPNWKNYDWSDATVDTLEVIISYFSQVAGAVTTASKIVDYWKHAAEPSTNDSSTLAENWNLWDADNPRTDELSHYVEFEQTFPPEERFRKEYVDTWVTNNLNHELSDFTNYSHTWGISIAVLPNPETASQTELDEYGIERVPVSESSAVVAEDSQLGSNDFVYVARDPPVDITRIVNSIE